MVSMMKNILLFAFFLLSAVSLHAQKIYLCEGFDADDITLTDPSNFTFSSDQKTVTIEGTTYNISDIDSITFAEPQFESVDIVWNGSSATVNIPASLQKVVTANINGGHVTIISSTTDQEILYTLSGSSSNGSLTINGNYKFTMHLKGVSLTSGNALPALNILCGKRIEMKMMKGTTNSFEDNAMNTSKGAVYIKGHLEVKGKGTLNVTGKSSHALKVGEYCQFKSSTGDVNILSAVSDGFHCGDNKKRQNQNDPGHFHGRSRILAVNTQNQKDRQYSGLSAADTDQQYHQQYQNRQNSEADHYVLPGDHPRSVEEIYKQCCRDGLQKREDRPCGAQLCRGKPLLCFLIILT